MNLATRPYRMQVRAQAAAATGERILDAAIAAFWEKPSEEIVLQDIAHRAGVTVQTVIRRFGGRDHLFAAALEREARRVGNQRNQAPVGDPSAAVRNLLDHYEAMGDAVIRMLAEEARNPRLRPIVDTGRRVHRDWCARVFSPALAGLDPAAGRRRLAELVAICDVYTWKLLRRDSGLSRSETETALTELLRPLMEGMA